MQQQLVASAVPALQMATLYSQHPNQQLTCTFTPQHTSYPYLLLHCAALLLLLLSLQGISSKAKLQRAMALPAKLDNIKTTTVVSESTVIDQDTTKVISSKEPKTQKSANSKGQMLLQALKNKTDEVKQLELLLSYRGDQVATYKNMMSKALDVLQDSASALPQAGFGLDPAALPQQQQFTEQLSTGSKLMIASSLHV
jgi:hypothetical protein